MSDWSGVKFSKMFMSWEWLSNRERKKKRLFLRGHSCIDASRVLEIMFVPFRCRFDDAVFTRPAVVVVALLVLCYHFQIFDVVFLLFHLLLQDGCIVGRGRENRNFVWNKWRGVTISLRTGGQGHPITSLSLAHPTHRHTHKVTTGASKMRVFAIFN